MSSTTAGPAPVQPRRRIPLRRWMSEIGWRHVVGVGAVIFALFPIVFVISASVNPAGSITNTNLIPTEGVTVEHYWRLLSGERANFLRWYLNTIRSEEHTSELQSRFDLVCRLLLEKKN